MPFMSKDNKIEDVREEEIKIYIEKGWELLTYPKNLLDMNELPQLNDFMNSIQSTMAKEEIIIDWKENKDIKKKLSLLDDDDIDFFLSGLNEILDMHISLGIKNKDTDIIKENIKILTYEMNKREKKISEKKIFGSDINEKINKFEIEMSKMLIEFMEKKYIEFYLTKYLPIALKKKHLKDDITEEYDEIIQNKESLISDFLSDIKGVVEEQIYAILFDIFER